VVIYLVDTWRAKDTCKARLSYLEGWVNMLWAKCQIGSIEAQMGSKEAL